MNTLPLRWHLIRITPGSERKALASLTEAGFTDKFLPEETYWKRTRKARTRETRPLFHGYMFVATKDWGPQTCNLHGLAGVGGIVPNSNTIPPTLMARYVYDIRARQLAGEFDRAKTNEPKPKATAKATIKGPEFGLLNQILFGPQESRSDVLMGAAGQGVVQVEAGQWEEAA